MLHLKAVAFQLQMVQRCNRDAEHAHMFRDSSLGAPREQGLTRDAGAREQRSFRKGSNLWPLERATLRPAAHTGL